MTRISIPSVSKLLSSVFLAGAAGVALGTSAHCALVAHWPFDEGSGTTTADASGNAFTGMLSGNVTWASDALHTTYLNFNGVDGVVNPSFFLPQMTSTNDFSWAFFANTQIGIATKPNAVVLGNRYNGPGTTDFSPRQFIKFTPTKFEWHQNGNGNDNLDYDDYLVGEWHHHAVVKTGTTLDYYRDGAFVSTRTLNGAIGSAINPLFIGGNPGSGVGEFFNGFIDDVRLYDNALTASEVAAISVPEPATLAFGAAGILALALRRRR